MTQNISGYKKPSHFYKTSKRYQTQRYGSDRNSDRNQVFFGQEGPFSQEGETPGSGPQTVNIIQDHFSANDDKDNKVSVVSTKIFDLKNLPDNFVVLGEKFLHMFLIGKILPLIIGF